MTRLIVSIIFFIILAVFTALNGGYSTALNLFGYKLESISIVAVIIGSMALGVIYSFALYLSNFLGRQKASKLKKNRDVTKAKELELKDRERDIQDAIEQEKESDSPALTESDEAEIGAAVAGSELPSKAGKKKKGRGILRKGGSSSIG